MKKWIIAGVLLLAIPVVCFAFWLTDNSKNEYVGGQLPRIELNIEDDLDPAHKYNYSRAKMNVTDYENSGNNMKGVELNVRLRGNGTLSLPKKSYKLRFDSKTRLLEMGDGISREYVLLGQYGDTSSLQSYLSLRFADSLGGLEWTPDCRLVDTWINGEYMGIFLAVETIDIGCNKVDIINNPELEEDIGYLVILSAYHNGVDSFTINNATYSVKSELSDDSTLHDSQIEYISEYINECYDAVKSGEFETVDRLIDIDSLVDYYILQEYVMNNDLGWDSFYMYKNRGGKLFFGPGWDFDLTFGLDWSGGEYDKIYAASSEPRATSLNYWFYTAMEAQWFRKLVRDRFNEIETERKAMLDEIDRVYAKYSNSFENEWARWGARQDSFSWMFVGEYNSLNERIELLKIWLSGRDKYLDEIYNSERFIVDGLCEEDFYGSSKAQ